MGAALDAQRGVCLLAALGQLLIFTRQIAVFQAQHIDLVRQRMAAFLHGGELRFEIGAVALQLIHLPGQRGVLGREGLVLHDQSLGVAAQGVVLLPERAQLRRHGGQVLLIIGAEVLHGLMHVLRLIAAKARLAHTALLYVIVDVDFGHW